MSFDKHITPSPEQLLELGVQDTAQALSNLELVGAKLGAEGFSEIVPLMLADLPRAADPDMALNNIERFVSALTDIPSFVSLCRGRYDDVLRALIAIFGASRFLSSFLVAIADESLMFLADPNVLSYPTDKQQLAERLARLIGDHPDDREFFHVLRLFR